MKRIITLFILMMSITSLCLAANSTTINVKATIPQNDGLSVSVSKIVGTTWTEASEINFGTLYFDETYHIWRANCYYAVDVGINSNAPNWTIKHTTTSITNGSENLDNNINVAFVKQINDNEGYQLEKVSYANSNNKEFSKQQLSGGWLRIYYGIATGDTAVDAPGVEPITMEKPHGTYTGSVTLTLTTQ